MNNEGSVGQIGEESLRHIEGGCHCGNVRYRLTWPGISDFIPARACGCSFCRPRRATYTSHPEARLEAVIADAAHLSRYRFGTSTAEFFVCRRCGHMTFAVSEIDGREYAVVNVFTFDDAEAMEFDVSSTDFDGETVEERLRRRVHNWIPNVRISLRSKRKR
jgi:hypothetical protein